MGVVFIDVTDVFLVISMLIIYHSLLSQHATRYSADEKREAIG